MFYTLQTLNKLHLINVFFKNQLPYFIKIENFFDFLCTYLVSMVDKVKNPIQYVFLIPLAPDSKKEAGFSTFSDILYNCAEKIASSFQYVIGAYQRAQCVEWIESVVF